MKTTILPANYILPHMGDILGVLKKYGTEAGYTDLAAILGIRQTGPYKETKDGHSSSYSWTATPCGSDRSVYVSNDSGCPGQIISCANRFAGVRPVLMPSEQPIIKPKLTKLKDARGNVYENINVVHCGEYPQDVVYDDGYDIDKKMKEKVLSKGKHTGKVFTFDGTLPDAYNMGFNPISYNELGFRGRKFILLEARTEDESAVLQNDSFIICDKKYCIEVKPIEWLVDEKTGMWISKLNLFAGIQFDPTINDFSKNPFLKQYLAEHFDKEMLPSRQNIQQQSDPGEHEPTEPNNELGPWGQRLAILREQHFARQREVENGKTAD